MHIFILIIPLYLLFPALGYYRMQTGLSPAAYEQGGYQGQEQLLERYREGKQLLKWGLWAIGIGVISIVPLMGLPGGLLLSLLELTGLMGNAMKGDNAWPSALIASLLFPPALPAGIWLRQLAGEAGLLSIRGWLLPGAVIVWVLAIGAIIRWLGNWN